MPPVKRRLRMLFVIGVAAGLSCLIYYLPALGFISEGFSIIICTIVAASLAAVIFPVETEDADDE